MKQVAIILLGIVSGIFVAKYSARLGVPGIPLGVFYFAVFVVVAMAATYIAPRSDQPSTGRLLLYATGGLSMLALVAVLFLPPASRVGRLPAIEAWLSDLLAGVFPYHAPNQPSGFPMLFILAFPTFVLGNVGLLEVLGVAVFGTILWSRGKTGAKGGWVPLVLLLLLPSMYYEVIVRSELFFNMILVLALVVFTDEYLATNNCNRKFVGSAVLFGLALSTRSTIGLVYVIYVLWRFRSAPLRGAFFSAIVILVFLLTLIPFVVWDPAHFFSNGPFSIQFGYLPLWIILAFFGAAVIAGLAAHDMMDVLFYSGVLLFAVVFTAFALRVNESGVSATLYLDRFDISYFVFCVPFLLFSLHDHRN
jgi:hypothetical protein